MLYYIFWASVNCFLQIANPIRQKPKELASCVSLLPVVCPIAEYLPTDFQGHAHASNQAFLKLIGILDGVGIEAFWRSWVCATSISATPQYFSPARHTLWGLGRYGLEGTIINMLNWKRPPLKVVPEHTAGTAGAAWLLAVFRVF